MVLKRIKILIISFLIINICAAQNFNDFFENKTLRIDYIHSGNLQEESIKIQQYWEKDDWDGSYSNLTVENYLGSLIFEVYDSATHHLLYSKSASSLFEEYRNTEKGKTEIVHYEECMVFPKPKKTVQIRIISYNRYLEKNLLLDIYMNPKKIKTVPMKKQYQIKDIHIGGDNHQAYNILIVPDGYTKKELSKMRADMDKFGHYIMECSPFKELQQYVNIRGVEGFSKESGITDPIKNIYINTLINCSFNTIEVDRYLMCQHLWKLHQVADDAPYDIILIMANTSKYGGGGIYNFYATVYADGPEKTISYVVVHEFGHAIAGLGDEYYANSQVSVQDYYPSGIEPVEPNLTTLIHFDSKWKHLIDKDIPIPTPGNYEYANKVGVFEGGGYCSKGVYRPFLNCTMKDGIYNYFCPVCKETIRKSIIQKIKQ